MKRIPRGRIETELEDLSYPVIRSDAAVELSDVAVPLDGEEANLGELVSGTDSDTYHSPEEILEELETVLDDR